jgi:hypothetical protein
MLDDRNPKRLRDLPPHGGVSTSPPVIRNRAERVGRPAATRRAMRETPRKRPDDVRSECFQATQDLFRGGAESSGLPVDAKRTEHALRPDSQSRASSAARADVNAPVTRRRPKSWSARNRNAVPKCSSSHVRRMLSGSLKAARRVNERRSDRGRERRRPAPAPPADRAWS